MQSTVSRIRNGVKSYTTGNIDGVETEAKPVAKRAERIPTEEDIAFGKRLKDVREMRGYTYEDFAVMTGIDYSQVWRWETGKNEPKREAIKVMATALEVSADYLLGTVTEPRGLLADPTLTPGERRLIHMLRAGELKKALNTISEMAGGD